MTRDTIHDDRQARRSISIRERLAASAIVLVLIVVSVIAAASYREVRRSAIAAESQRAEHVSHQLADGYAASAKQLLDAQLTASKDSAVVRHLADGDTAQLRHALAQLAARPIAKSSFGSVEVWDATGRRVMTSNGSIPALERDDAHALITLLSGHTTPAIGWIGGPANNLGFSIIAPVFADATLWGYLVERRRVVASAQTAAPLRNLVGAGATLLIGNTRGDRWTSLGVVVEPLPPGTSEQKGVVQYERPSGTPVLASAVGIRNTPWTLALEYPLDLILAPARTMLWRLALFTLVLLVLAGAGAWHVSGTLTRPIASLVTAAEGMNAGDESKRVEVRRSDELGALGVAFNDMADRVETTRTALEAKIHELVNAEERLERVIGSSGAVLYELQVTPDGPVLDWISHNVTDMLGYDLAEVHAPQWWRTHVHPDDDHRSDEERAPASYRAVSKDYRFRHKDGRYRWLREEQRLASGSAGQTVWVIGAWLDITEQKLLEERLRQTQKMEAMGMLAGGVAHDFNNILTVVRGYSSLLLAAVDDDPALTPMIGEIEKAADRAADLTSQLLSFSRGRVMERHVVDVSDVVRDIRSMLNRVIGEDIELAVRLDAEFLPVLADRGQLSQVVMNLVINARDAMPDGGRLSIETSRVSLTGTHAEQHAARPGQYVVITITDTGAGMDAATQSRIFEPFFTTKPEGRGTGLGLSTVFGIVKQLEGNIWVYSEPEHGTTFKVYLPQFEGGARVVEPEAEPVAEPRIASAIVLVVEDDPIVRQLTRRLLARSGYAVLDAENGVAALDVLREAHVDVVITDTIMPEMGGHELMERLLVERPTLPVVLTSGYTADTLQRQGRTPGLQLFIEKPFTGDELDAVVQDALRHSRGNGQLGH
ncbi:MAG: ATP-binding protein [Gemmatimonadota bacterium]